MSSNNPTRIPQSGIRKPSEIRRTDRPAPSGTVSGASKTVPQTPTAPSNWQELEAKYKQDIETLTESTEMATIEKEIAEEKLDNCERELGELKEKLSEVAKQNDLLKKDLQTNQQIGAGSSESTVTLYQLQKLEEQNEAFKQALIKVRDISANDRQALEAFQIEHEKLQEKLLDLEEKEEKYLDQIKIYEEQIDVCQSAQEMVEKLTQQKTELEDKLKRMVEDFDELEELRDVNEQLLEKARENEFELTNQLDLLKVQYAKLNNKRCDLEDYLTDKEETLAKLREENRQLSEKIAGLKDQFKEGESLEQQKHQIENVAYKLNFSESKMAEKDAEINRYRRNLAEMEEQMNSLSLITKEQSNRLDELKSQFQSKVNENGELQRALKKKMEEVSELTIRRDMAEKKLQAIQKDAESKANNLERTIEKMKGVEIQHEEDIKRLMEDNEIIERERRELRDQLNKSNRSLERSMQTGNMSMMTALDTSLASLGISLQAGPPNPASPLNYQQTFPTQPQQLNQSMNMQHIQSSQITPSSAVPGPASNVFTPVDVDESIFLGKYKDLSRAFDQINRKNYELEVELAERQLDNKRALYPRSNLTTYYDMERIHTLRAEMRRLKKDMRLSIINQELCTKSRNILSSLRNEKFNNSKLALRYQALENEVSALISNSTLARLQPRAPLLQSTPNRLIASQ